MIHQTENMVQHCVFVALFQHFIQLMLQRKTKKHRLPNKKQLLSAIYKYKYVFITIVSHYETKFLLKYWLQKTTTSSSISVEQTTISISRIFFVLNLWKDKVRCSMPIFWTWWVYWIQWTYFSIMSHSGWGATFWWSTKGCEHKCMSCFYRDQ